jgi:phage head maturation protease
VNQSSFAFLIEKDRWEQRDGKTYRIIEKISRLLDVSPVAQPAYPSATSELKTRDLESETKTEVATASDHNKSESIETQTESADDTDLYLYKLKTLNF